MHNYALTTDGRPVTEVEETIKAHLPGLDVDLIQFSPRQAVLRGHAVRALDIEYAPNGAASLLRDWGVERIQSLSDEETVTLLRTRDLADLEPRRVAAAPPGTRFDWHLEACSVPAAWALLGGPEAIAWGDVRIGHIDTGYTEHPALGFPSPWVLTRLARTFVIPPRVGEGSPDTVELGDGRDNLAGFSGGHGTRMAGTMCGFAPSENYYGVAPKVPLIPVRITDSVWINHVQAEFAQAVHYLTQTERVSVINVSLGVFPGTGMSRFREAVARAYEAGVIVACAAGNYVNSVVSPACLSRTVAVAGVTDTDAPWSGSSYGLEVDISAPAGEVRRASTSRTGKFRYEGGGDGTSYASAMTSGAAALWLAYHGPAIDAAYPEPWQRVEAFAQLLRATARKPTNWNPGAFGNGVLNVANLLGNDLPSPSILTKALST